MDWRQFFTSPWLWFGVLLLCIGVTAAVFIAAYRRPPVDDLCALIDAVDESHEDLGLDDEARALVISYLNAAWVYPTANHYPEREHCE